MKYNSAITIFTVFSPLLAIVQSNDNSVAMTPPMGWLHWLRFFCQTDCKTFPLSCVSENLVKDMADRISADGYKDAGYEYVNLDDCWMATERDSAGHLQPDPLRFPGGMKALADYVHSKGLKMGIYQDYGTKTCAGFPGSLDHVEQDAQTFADWGIDYVKFDACNVEHEKIEIGYPEMSLALNKTGRPMVYSCEWAFYQQFYLHRKPDYPKIRKYCNLWRVYDDIGSDWPSVLRTIQYFDSNQDELIQANGPGGWNDPDMLSIGNSGLTEDQAKVQFGIWAIWSAPLLMSNDLRFIAKRFKDILLNKKVIAVNQDPLGVMGRLVANTTFVGVYLKAMTPVKRETHDGSYAIAFLNRNSNKKANIRLIALKNIGLKNKEGYEIEDLFTNQKFGVLFPNSSFNAVLNPTSILLLKATVL